MQITEIGTEVSQKRPEEWFTASVRINPLFGKNYKAEDSYTMMITCIFSL